MITQTKDIDKNFLKNLKISHFSRRIRSHFEAYKTDYDFCRFFLIKDDTNVRGIVSVFNSSMVVSEFCKTALTDEDIFELSILVNMTKPVTVELELSLAEKLYEHIKDDYNSIPRVEFEFVCKEKLPDLGVNETPRLDDVYDILQTSFPIIKQTGDLWLTDTSHRIRRGLSQSFTLDSVTSATIQYLIDDIAFVGHVATIPSERGKHHARELLYWIGEKLNEDGFKVRLYARDYNVSYYTEIGFVPVNKDVVLERKIFEETN